MKNVKSNSGSPAKTLGIFGGSFDPIHIGHLHGLWEVTQQLPLDTIHIIPSAQSPNKKAPQATAEQRLEMLDLAIQNQPRWEIDEREIDRGGNSYTIDTLKSLHKQYPDHHLCLIIGMDVAINLLGWRSWQEILSYAHLIVLTRPDYKLPETPWVMELQRRTLKDPEQLRAEKAGCVIWQKITSLAICATEIRKLCNAQQAPPFLVPTAVWDYIQDHQLYRINK
jgi:nicotinate-nucleotide adenylyltransferase